jgi:hypothetical protein
MQQGGNNRGQPRA